MALSKEVQVLGAHVGTDLAKVKGKPHQIKIDQGKISQGKPGLLMSHCNLADLAILQVHICVHTHVHIHLVHYCNAITITTQDSLYFPCWYYLPAVCNLVAVRESCALNEPLEIAPSLSVLQYATAVLCYLQLILRTIPSNFIA